jgi:hypothetical protein
VRWACPLDPHGMMHSAQFGFVAIIPRTVPVWSLEDSTLCKSCFEQYASLSLWGSSTSSSARSTPGRAEGPSAKAPARAAFVCAWACEAPADLSDLTGPCCRADGECAERRCERRLALAPAAWQTWTAPPGPPPTRACHKRLQRRAWATAGLQKRQLRRRIAPNHRVRVGSRTCGAARPKAALAPSAPAAHRFLMRCARAARSESRASARSQRCCGLRARARRLLQGRGVSWRGVRLTLSSRFSLRSWSHSVSATASPEPRTVATRSNRQGNCECSLVREKQCSITWDIVSTFYSACRAPRGSFGWLVQPLRCRAPGGTSGGFIRSSHREFC